MRRISTPRTRTVHPNLEVGASQVEVTNSSAAQVHNDINNPKHGVQTMSVNIMRHAGFK